MLLWGTAVAPEIYTAIVSLPEDKLSDFLLSHFLCIACPTKKTDWSLPLGKRCKYERVTSPNVLFEADEL